MRRVLVLIAFVIALLVPAVATAATPTNAQLAAQIKALKATVTKQGNTIKTLQRNVDSLANFATTTTIFAVCTVAVTADAVQGLFNVVDQIAVNTPNVAHTFFGPQTPVNDQTYCNLLRIARTQAVPPTTATFSALLSLIRAPTASAPAFAAFPTSWN
jgi:hypothetical protein